MTVILGYTNNKGDQSIGSLVADNLVIYPQEGNKPSKSRKGDKLNKILDRFTIGITGAGAVDTMIEYCFIYPQRFDNLKPNISNIEELAVAFKQCFSYSFPKLKEQVLKSLPGDYKEMKSELIVLDCKTNKLYYQNLGKVLDETNEFNVQFTELRSGKLYCFGLPVKNKERGYDTEDLSEMDKNTLINYLTAKIKIFQSLYRTALGQIGCYQINVLDGDNILDSYFKSSYNSYMDFINQLASNT